MDSDTIIAELSVYMLNTTFTGIQYVVFLWACTDKASGGVVPGAVVDVIVVSSALVSGVLCVVLKEVTGVAVLEVAVVVPVYVP